MPEKLVGKLPLGFSTIEIIIALALMVTIISGALSANFMAYYWRLTAVTAGEALAKAKGLIEGKRAAAPADFYSLVSVPMALSRNLTDPTDAHCLAGGFCYVTETQVDDISSCSKTLLVTVSWQLGARYATSTIALFTHLTQPEEVIARGGDCLLMAPTGDWFGSVPSQVGSVSQLPQFTTGFDVLGEFVYMVASSAPQLRIYATPTALGQAPVLVGSSTGMGNRLNAIDVIRDFGTGRTYAYVMQHTKTDQLGVFDVTNPASPTWLLSLSLSGADPTGSFPQGWRVVAYGERLYTLTRDTLGFEFHVFDIGDPSSPQPVHSSMVNLVRTVNDMTVREQTLAGLKRRFVFLAASAGLKELVLLEVTRGVPVERSVVNLPGAADAAALYLRGNLLYLGRRNNNSGPELYVFDIPTLLGGSTSSLAVAELGADVTTIRGTGAVLYVGTSKSGEEFQVWPADYTVWQATVPNASRI